MESVRTAWVKLLEDLGLQYEFVASQQIEEGYLQDEGYKLLILPESLALSDAEAAQIQQFVTGGGAVLADMRCGVMDELCRPRATPELDELFGVSRLEPTGQPPASGLVMAEALGDVSAGTELAVIVPEDALQLDGGTAFAHDTGDAAAPAVILNTAGSGRAVYLNMDLSQFEAERKFHSPTESAIRGIVLAMFADAGVQPAYRLIFESGTAPHVEMTRHHVGDLTLVGLQREFDASEPDEIAMVHLPVPAFVYNMRQHKALGRLSEVTVPMAAGETVLLCISPRELGGPTLALAGGGAARGDTIGYQVTGAAGEGVAEAVHVRVLRPDGSAAEDYTQNLIVREGQAAAGSIPLALNDAAGMWRVVARSALSGSTAEAAFEVR